MSTSIDEKNTTGVLENGKIDVKLKLAVLWASVMFVYAYVDIIGFYEPGTIPDILAGIVFEFEITQTWALVSLAFLTIPSLMVFLSVALPARVNRWTNIIIATLYIPFTLYNVTGESWVYYFGFGAVVEVALLALVVWYAWKWPMMSEATDYTDSSARADKSV